MRVSCRKKFEAAEANTCGYGGFERVFWPKLFRFFVHVK